MQLITNPSKSCLTEPSRGHCEPIAFAVGVLLVILGLTGCARSVPIADVPPPPPVFESTPDLAQLAAAINRTDAIRQLSTNAASVDVLSMPAVPKLSATMHLERDRNFRMRASVPIVMGTGIDLGSNDNEFWFEVPEGMSQTLYHARHNQYAQQLDRAVLPVDPTWMMQAIGLARIEPSTVIAGPVTRTDGLLEIRNTVPTPVGTYQRVCFIEPTAGYITHLFLYSPNSRLVAKSHATDHRYYDMVNCVLPHEVKMELFPAAGPPLAMQLKVSTYTVNQLLSGDPQLFAMPTDTRNKVDLTQLAGSIGQTDTTQFSVAGAGGVSGGASLGSSKSAWAQPTTSASPASVYTANGPTGPPLRGIRYE